MDEHGQFPESGNRHKSYKGKFPDYEEDKKAQARRGFGAAQADEIQAAYVVTAAGRRSALQMTLDNAILFSYLRAMDWTPIIAHNRDALLRVAAALLVMVAGIADRVPRTFQRSVLRLLIPAESALRRLIVIAARGLVVDPPVRRQKSAKPVVPRGPNKNRRKAVFRFLDLGRTFGSSKRRLPLKNEPRVWSVDEVRLIRDLPQFQPAPPPRKAKSKPDGLVDAHRLLRRIEALTNALNDIPAQARRLALWRLRPQRNGEAVYTWPLRGGPPPGHRRKPAHDVDHILADCHAFAYESLRPDTS